MKRFTTLFCLSAVSIALLSGCASTPVDKANSSSGSLPDWVMAPMVDGGIASTSCVRDTGNFSLDRAQATANARASLTKEIGVKVQAMDKEYMRNSTGGGQSEQGGTFESVSRQVANEFIVGSRPAKVDYVNINDQRNLCVMVAMQPEATKGLFESIMRQSKRKLSPQNEEILLEEFRAAKAQNELIEATR